MARHPTTVVAGEVASLEAQRPHSDAVTVPSGQAPFSLGGPPNVGPAVPTSSLHDNAPQSSTDLRV